MATASWIPLTLVVCLMVSVFQVESADSLTCTVTRNGTVSSFTGETLSVGLPCHFRLAQFRVGDYKVQLTAGTDKKSETFSLSDLTLEVTDTVTNKSMMTRTKQRRLKKEKRGKRVWLRPGGSLPDVILDFNDSLKAAIAKLPNGFQLTFTKDNVVLTVAAGCNLDSQPFPASLCGDGVTGNATSSAARALFGDGWETSLSALTHYSVLNADTVSQEGACWCLRNQLQSCVNKSEAVKQCHPIFSEEGRMKCLNQSDMPLTDFYSDCLTSVCDGDTAVLDDMNNHFSENCPEYLDEEEPVCPSSRWRRLPCLSDADCQGVTHAGCYNLLNYTIPLCQCDPGYMYNPATNCCSLDCDPGAPNLVWYVGVDISVDANYIAESDEADDGCFDKCASDPVCVMYVFHGGIYDTGKCLTYDRSAVGKVSFNRNAPGNKIFGLRPCPTPKENI